MVIVHLSSLENRLHLWAESDETHPLALSSADLHLWMEGILGLPLEDNQNYPTYAWLPGYSKAPEPSPQLAGAIELPKSKGKISLRPYAIDTCFLSGEELLLLLILVLESPILGDETYAGYDLRFWASSYQWCLKLLVNQSYYPGLVYQEEVWKSRWKLLFEDREERILQKFARQMPSSARCLGMDNKKAPLCDPLLLMRKTLHLLADHWIRLQAEKQREGFPMLPKEPAPTAQAEWLDSLYRSNSLLSSAFFDFSVLEKQIKTWQSSFLIQKTLPFQLLLQVKEPAEDEEGESTSSWHLEYLIQSRTDPSLIIPLKEVWQESSWVSSCCYVSTSQLFQGVYHLLGLASKLCGELLDFSHQARPSESDIGMDQLLDLIYQKREILEKAGIRLLFPDNWKDSRHQLRMDVQVHDFEDNKSFFSLDRLVSFDWKISIGDKELDQKELNALVKLKTPLIRIRGQWLLLDQENLTKVLQAVQKRKKKLPLGHLLRQGLESLESTNSLPYCLHFGAGFKQFQDILDKNFLEEPLQLPGNLEQILRPYQRQGVAWLHTLKSCGLHPCLADDMGLGKTLQVLALLSKEHHDKSSLKPSLLICPTAVLENWKKEGERFTPDLSLYIHHGSKRLHGIQLKKESSKHQLVVTSYALALRDREDLHALDWENLILDEAQNIKNHESQQCKAIKKVEANFRLALTGTPLENHVGDLWSLFDFLQPGWLGNNAEFQTHFYRPIQVYGKPDRIEALQRMTQPFILRRVKTDPTIIADLPDKIESKEYCLLSKEQVSLYEACLKNSMQEIERSEGISRRGKILSLILHLKQICNHPAQYLKESKTLEYKRSGKLSRLWELLREIAEKKEKALLFTQYTQLGELMQAMLQQSFQEQCFFYHGGLTRSKREKILEQFERDPHASWLILSLKAGGTGLNLTSANHVFHVDRWWNPAVENQATDRAFRIGQHKNVHVHKMICTGTMEEAVDQLIEKKTSIAGQIISNGENWLSEMSNSSLRELLMLRREVLRE